MAIEDVHGLSYAGLGSWQRFSIRSRLILRRLRGAWGFFRATAWPCWG